MVLAGTLNADIAQRSGLLDAAGHQDGVDGRRQSGQQPLSRHIDLAGNEHADLPDTSYRNRCVGSDIGAMDGCLEILAETAKTAPGSGKRRQSGQDDLAVSIDLCAKLAVFLAAQRNHDLIAGAQYIIVLNRAGLSHGNVAAAAQLVIAELFELGACPCRKNLLETR
ncbi:MAG: hypothetical protein V4559_14795 [Pseudomonadota bacterium]